MMELESDTYDVVVIGTGLAESLAAASLANSGKSILHLDPNDYYGGSAASLTLDELATWASTRNDSSISSSEASSSASPYMTAQRRRYTHTSTSPLTPTLESSKRQYALSLFPALLPGRGKLIQTLIDSGVSNYVGFRLLDTVCVWESAGEEEGKGKGKGRVRRVPGSKEEVFKDKSISLVDKRRLMKFLMFVAGEFEGDDLLKGKETIPLSEFLSETFSLPPDLSQSIIYAIAHSSTPSEPTLPALLRTRRYLRSIGRYGPSPFLIGQYGGAGEIAQGFCRACAVKGGTYILGEQAEVGSIELTPNGEEGKRISLKLPCHPRPITANHLISTPDHIPPELLPTPSDRSERVTAHCITVLSALPSVLQRSSEEARDGEKVEDDTAVILFPPEAGRGLVRGLIMGEGTGSCPTGQFVLYLNTTVPTISNTQDPSDILTPYLERLSADAVFASFYLSHESDLSCSEPSPDSPVVLMHPYPGGEGMTEGLDWEAEQGEKAFWAVMGEKETWAEGIKGWWEKEEAGGEEGEDEEQIAG